LQPTAKARPEEFRRALEQVVSELVPEIGLSNLHFIKGPDVLTNIGGLTVDIIHPADLAMILMGENLAKKLKPLVGV
jgi:lysophospholipase L1-like esterase